MRRQLITLLLALIIAVSFSVVQAQTGAPHERIVAAVEAGNWQTVLTELKTIKTTDPQLFQTKGYDYLFARASENAGDIPSATAAYEQVIKQGSPLSAYALWHLAKIARSKGDLVLERERLRRIIATSPQSLFFEPATLRLAESLFESGDFAAVPEVASGITRSKNTALVREAAALTGQAYVRAGKLPEARDVLTKLLMQMPDASRPDDFALTAVRELDSLDKTSGAPALTEADHLLRASVYQFNRDFAGARFHYQAVIDGFPQSPTIPNALYQLGRGLYLESRYDEALKILQKVVDQYPTSTSARDALATLATSYLRLQRPADGIATYKLLIDRFPDAPNPERPYLNIIDALHEGARYTEALNWVRQTRAKFKGSIGDALALFAQMRIHLAQESWTDVITDADELARFPDLGGVKVSGGTTSAEVAFLRAYALEKLGRIDDAITAYLAIPDGRNEYYGARATQRLLALANNGASQAQVQARLKKFQTDASAAVAGGQWEQARVAYQATLRLTADPAIRAATLHSLQGAYDALPNYKLPRFNQTLIEQWYANETSTAPDHKSLAALLGNLGLHDEAMPELLAARTAASRQPSTTNSSTQNGFSDYGYSTAVYSLRGGFANRAVRFGEQVWKVVPADYVLELAPRELVEFLYPVPYREMLLQHAPPRKVDPRFVLSIARQESRYQVDAKSVAAARGMMQFIAATANETAAQLNLRGFNQDDLYDPNNAILFGSQYLSRLFEQFPGQPAAVAASYNGGADNMLRWKARSRSSEPDRFVPEIGFSQSKDYVFKVMTNFWNYSKLYDDHLQPTSRTNK